MWKDCRGLKLLIAILEIELFLKNLQWAVNATIVDWWKIRRSPP